MKIKITFTPGETRQAQRAQAALLRLFDCCRIHSTQTGEHCIIYLTFRF